MVIEKTAEEYIIRVPISIDLGQMQELLNYLRYLELTGKFSASEKDVEELVANTKLAWRKKRKKERP